jgi:hypothetical protein
LSYKPTRHGKAGVGATKGSAHSSLKWINYTNLRFFIHIVLYGRFHYLH